MSVGTFSTFPSFFPPPIPSGPGEAHGIKFRKWTVDEYHRMMEAGVLKEGEPVELLEGWISYLVPRGAPEPALRKWSVDEYYRLLDIGVLEESERVELLEGWIVQRMPRNSPHETAIQKAGKRLRAIVPAGWDVREQKVMSLSDSQPEPDCAIVAGDEDTYSGGHPTPADVAIEVEVSDSTLSIDRNWMGRIYGRAGIVVYWIVNVRDRQVEVYTDPTGPTDPPDAARYRHRHDYRETDAVPVVIHGREVGHISVTTLFARA